MKYCKLICFSCCVIICGCISNKSVKTLSKLNEIPEFLKATVHIGDKLELVRKINRIVDDGPSKLQIVTDFDQTLTRHTTDNGTLVLSSFVNRLAGGAVLYERDNFFCRPTAHVSWGKLFSFMGMLQKCPSIPQYYKDEVSRLSNKYKPIEADPLISTEDKRKHMTEWYIMSRDLIKNITFPRNELLSIAKEMVPHFRTGVKDLITWSQKNEVPVLVFSAGFGEAVTATLEAADLLLPHVKVISNFLKFDDLDYDRIIGFEGELISIYNKNQGIIKGTEYCEKVKTRSNVILMGDSIGDADMTEGMENCDTVIKVGFLGHKVTGNLDNYLRSYDVVLVNETSINIVNAILKLVS